MHSLYRSLACEYISTHRDTFEPFIEDETFDEFLTDICEDGVWAGNIELQALALALEVNIMIHRAEGQATSIEGASGARWIHLAYQLGNHYNSIRRPGDTGPAQEISLSVLESEGLAATEEKKEVEELAKQLEDQVLETAEPPKVRNARPDVYPADAAPCWCGSKRRYYKCCKPYDIP